MFMAWTLSLIRSICSIISSMSVPLGGPISPLTRKVPDSMTSLILGLICFSRSMVILFTPLAFFLEYDPARLHAGLPVLQAVDALEAVQFVHLLQLVVDE